MSVKCSQCGKMVQRKWAISDVKINENGTGLVVYTCVRCG